MRTEGLRRSRSLLLEVGREDLGNQRAHLISEDLTQLVWDVRVLVDRTAPKQLVTRRVPDNRAHPGRLESSGYAMELQVGLAAI